MYILGKDIEMKKQDLTTPAIIMEAMEIILGLVYIGLQIFYGITFHVKAYTFILNILTMILVYSGLTLLSNYPEKINRIPAEMCVGNIRRYSLWMIRLEKFIFVVTLLIPCVFDVAGIEILNTYSLIVIGLMIIIGIYFEYKIIKELRNNK